jgi:Mg2+ and Co2+ transporter CorA
MAMHRASNRLKMPGDEPGVDPRRRSANVKYGNIRERCSIQVISYGATHAEFETLENSQLAGFLKQKRPLWAKIRWIKIGGISWDVVKPLALKYDLHPLSLEDVIHARQTAQSKADYYTRHLFLSILSHSLGQEEPETDAVSTTPDNAAAYTDQITASPRNSISRNAGQTGWNRLRQRVNHQDGQSAPLEDEESGKASQTTVPYHSQSRSSTTDSLDTREKKVAIATLEELKKGARINVKCQRLYIFVMRDGTVISIHKDTDPTFAGIIVERIRAPESLLRTTSDASLLVQAILDYIVDNTMEIVEKYHERILRLEKDILLKPRVETVNQLHILSGDLALHKRTLSPVKSLIYGLRRYDLDRCIAMEESRTGDQVDKSRIEGYMSHKAKVYLADVYDHMEYVLDSLDMFSNIGENLVNYTFNVISYETNQTMRMLTLATIIFFPLTFLTGYFGMNFARMWSVQQNSDALFWKITIPVMVVVVTLFLWPDIRRFIHFLQKRAISKRAHEAHRRR